MRSFAAVVLVVAGLSVASCGGIVDPSKNTVDTFNDTLAIGGSKAYPFSASKTGEISVKITALAPTSNTLVGLLWSQALSDGSCSTTSIGSVYQQNNFAQLNIPGISGSILQGKYCLMVYDSGGFTQAMTYTVTVSHP
jgi:hypothetical protein